MSRSLPFLSSLFRLTLWCSLALVMLFAWQPRSAAAQEGPTPRIYEVQAGDTLVGISERLGITPEALMEANQLTNPDLIYVGQKLAVPVVTPSLPAGAITYQMQADETLLSLAAKINVLPNDLLVLNQGMRAQYFALEPEIFIPDLSPAAWPDPILAFRHSPVIIQGQTGVVELVLSHKERPDGFFDQTPLHFFYVGRTTKGYHYRALMPTGALLPPGNYGIKAQVPEATVQSVVPVEAGSYETQYIVLPPDKSALLTPKRVQAELIKLHAVWDLLSERRLWRKAFRFPIGEGFQRTSPYGTRRSYNGGPVNSFHSGSDWGAPEGTPITAPAQGIVVLAEPLDVRGGAVILDHGQGVTSSFWHLSQIDVQVGQRLKRGEQIGLVGTTGLSTGAHLHWEVRVGGIAVDPMQWTHTYFPYAPMAAAQPPAS
ncbi:MAG: peptidoglycan DD-metalloendopeptidase family protein [Chloroflexi bacterium]|nr:peptidoglycan DD-metalloendopeptidase family protein [Chloroflexota bacterium]